MAAPLRVLLVEDNPSDVRLVLHELRQGGFDPQFSRAENEAEFLALLDPDLDVILCDYNLPQFDALSALQLLQQSGFAIPLLVVSGSIGEEVAVEAIKKGATDYLLKDRLGRLGLAVTQALEQRKLREAETRTRDALRASESLLRNIITNIPCAVFWKDCDSKYLGCNDRLVWKYGLKSVSEIIGRTDLEVGIGEAEARAFLDGDRRIIETGEPLLNLEEKLTRSDGSTLILATSRVPMRDPFGAVIGILGVFQDITDRKRLEEQYRQSHKMEAIGQLAGGIAHDFNNLLTVINGYSDILLSQCQPVDSFHGPLAEIHQAGERAAGLTAQLLAFSRKSIVEPKLLDLNEVIERLVKLLGRLIGDDIKVSSSLAPNLSQLRADRSQMEQVVLNIAVNARDAMPRGGRLTIETKDVDVDVDRAFRYPDCMAGRYVRLAISDTGTGMTDEVRAKLFEPFFTTKGPGKGTGLGLATVYGIVKQAGGHISVYSELGVGTTFQVLFPAIAGDLDRSTEAEDSRPTVGKETILLVEDEAGVRTFTWQALEAQGYSVLPAGSAKEAIDLSDGHDGAIHLLVTDVVMAEMGGRELAESLRGRRPGIRVLYMSGYTDDVVIRHGVIDAHDAFLQKPFTPLGLSRKVRAVLDGNS